MAVFQNRPYERHMVSNIPTLLPAGLTLDALGVGQLGIFDAKTNLSVTSPSYQANKTIYIAQGTPDRSDFAEGAGVPNIYRRTHPIQGKKLISLRAKKANRGQGEIVVLGNTGVPGDTRTLIAKPGQTFYYWVRLTGDPIFNLNPDQTKGVIIQGAVQMPCADECADNCGNVDCKTITDLVTADWATKLLPGGSKTTKYLEVKAILNCGASAEVEQVPQYKHSITIPSCGSGGIGEVQAQSPGFVITSEGTVAGYTTYSTVSGLNPTGGCNVPEDFVIAGGTIVTDCETCPDGFTAQAEQDQYQVRAEGTTDISVAIQGAVAGSTVTLVLADTLTNISTYTVNTAVGATTEDGLETSLIGIIVEGSATFLGVVQGYCVNNAPVTYPWSDPDCETVFCNKAAVQFTITLRDDECGVGFLDELLVAYDSIVVANASGETIVEDASGECGHSYTLNTVSSNCVEPGCAPESVVFPEISDFRGVSWTKVELAQPSTCLCGLEFSSPYKPRETKSCTFDSFPYQTDFVHVEVSSHNPDWRSTDICEVDPIATRVQGGIYPNGSGQAVARLEKQDRMYDMDYFYMSPILREAFDFYLETDFGTYYDMVAVEYEFQYSSNDGFGQTDTDRYVQYFWLPETQAGNLVNALNSYAASANINVDPIVL